MSVANSAACGQAGFIELTVTTSKASTALADPTPSNNVVVGSYRQN